MGKDRTPRPLYNNGFVVTFNVKDSEEYYTILKWNDDGYTQSVIEKGKVDQQTPQQILDNALQLFTEVGKNWVKL